MKLKLKTNPVTTPVQRVEELPIPNKLKKYETCQSGKMAKGDRIPIDTPDHICQRPLHPQRVINWAVDSEEVDWNLFGYTTAVRLTDGSLRRINGKHRMQLVKWLLPDVKKVPAHIIDCDDDKYAAKLFTEMNGTHSTQLSGEELLWAGCIAELAWAMYTKKFLDLAELSCGMVNEDIYPHSIKRAIFEKSLSYSEEGTMHAVNLFKKAYPTKEVVEGQIICGMARLFSVKKGGEFVYDDLMNTNTELGKMFEQWFLYMAMGHRPKYFFYNHDKGNGGWEATTAYKMYEDFLIWCQNQGLRHKCPQIGPVQAIYARNKGEAE